MTESESEVEEDCDLWLDEAGRQWMRTAGIPWEVVLAWYTGFDGEIWWVGRARLGFLGSDVGCGCFSWMGSNSFFVARRCATTGAMGVHTEARVPLHASVHWILGEFLAFLARVVHTWKYGALFRRGLVSGSLVSGVWVLLVEYRWGSVHRH